MTLLQKICKTHRFFKERAILPPDLRKRATPEQLHPHLKIIFGSGWPHHLHLKIIFMCGWHYDPLLEISSFLGAGDGNHLHLKIISSGWWCHLLLEMDFSVRVITSPTPGNGLLPNGETLKWNCRSWEVMKICSLQLFYLKIILSMKFKFRKQSQMEKLPTWKL
jgi:hypothetical protein